MNQEIDRRILDLDLVAALLELELAPDPHEVADARIRENVEALRFETGIIRGAFHPLPACMRFGVAADRGAAAEPRQKWLVVHAAAHESTRRVPRRARRVSLLRGRRQRERAQREQTAEENDPAPRARRERPAIVHHVRLSRSISSTPSA